MSNAQNLASIALLGPIPYDIGGAIIGVPDPNAVVTRVIANRKFLLPANFTGSVAGCSTVATATTTLTIYKNGASIGTITFAAGATLGTFAGAGASFVVNDVLTIANQATSDATFGNAEFTLAATLQ